MTRPKLRVLDLFSGIGGFSLGLERTGGFETVAFCETDPFCRKVLNKHWPDVPIMDDVRTLNADGLGRIDIITGGYPCQPFSLAGQRKGSQDDRHLWPAMFAIIKAVRPTWIIGENVAGHISMGLDEVLSDLEAEGYTTRPFVIPACAVDAPHRRDRVWILANTECDDEGRKTNPGKSTVTDKTSERVEEGWNADVAHSPGKFGNGGNSTALHGGTVQELRKFGGGSSVDDVSHSGKPGLQGCAQTGHDGTNGTQSRDKQPAGCGGVQRCEWPLESSLCRVADGIPNRIHRLRSLGNAVVPQIPELIGRAILEGANDGR